MGTKPGAFPPILPPNPQAARPLVGSCSELTRDCQQLVEISEGSLRALTPTLGQAAVLVLGIPGMYAAAAAAPAAASNTIVCIPNLTVLNRTALSHKGVRHHSEAEQELITALPRRVKTQPSRDAT
jgi:hypothetical protein